MTDCKGACYSSQEKYWNTHFSLSSPFLRSKRAKSVVRYVQRHLYDPKYAPLLSRPRAGSALAMRRRGRLRRLQLKKTLKYRVWSKKQYALLGGWLVVFVRTYSAKNPMKNPRLDQIRRLDVLDLKTQLKQI